MATRVGSQNHTPAKVSSQIKKNIIPKVSDQALAKASKLFREEFLRHLALNSSQIRVKEKDFSPRKKLKESSRQAIKKLKIQYKKDLPRIKRIEWGSKLTNTLLFVAYVFVTVAPLIWPDIPSWSPFLVMGASCLTGCFSSPFLLWATNKKQKYKENINFHKIFIWALKMKSKPHLVSEADVLEIDPKLSSDKRKNREGLSRFQDIGQSIDFESVNRRNALYSTRDYQRVIDKHGLIEVYSRNGMYRSVAARISRNSSEATRDFERQFPNEKNANGEIISRGILGKLESVKNDLLDPRQGLHEKTLQHSARSKKMLVHFLGKIPGSSHKDFLVNCTLENARMYSRMYAKAEKNYWKLLDVMAKLKMGQGDALVWHKFITEKLTFLPHPGLLSSWGYSEYWVARVSRVNKELNLLIENLSLENSTKAMRRDIIESCYIPKVSTELDFCELCEMLKDKQGNIDKLSLVSGMNKIRNKYKEAHPDLDLLEKEMAAYLELLQLATVLQRESYLFDQGYHSLDKPLEIEQSHLNVEIFIKMVQERSSFLKRYPTDHPYFELRTYFERALLQLRENYDMLKKEKVPASEIESRCFLLKDAFVEDIMEQIAIAIQKRYRPPFPQLLNSLEEARQKIQIALKKICEESRSDGDKGKLFNQFKQEYEDFAETYAALSNPQEYYRYLLLEALDRAKGFFIKKSQKYKTSELEETVLAPINLYLFRFEKSYSSKKIAFQNLKKEVKLLAILIGKQAKKNLSSQKRQKIKIQILWQLSKVSSEVELLNKRTLTEQSTSFFQYLKKKTPPKPYPKAPTDDERVLAQSLRKLDNQINKKDACLRLFVLIFVAASALIEFAFNYNLYVNIAVFSTVPFVGFFYNSYRQKSLGKLEELKKIFKLAHYFSQKPSLMTEKHVPPISSGAMKILKTQDLTPSAQALHLSRSILAS